MKRIRRAAALVSAVAVVGLAGCGSGMAPAGEYPDGTYSGTSEADDDGAVGQVEFTIEGGQVVDAGFVIVDADGTLRDEDYGKGAGGEIADEEFYRRAQNAIAAEAEYVAVFEETSDQSEVEAVAGASLSYRHFVGAIEDALSTADAS